MSFKNIGFIMTNKCSASCGICCFSCSPDMDTLLDKELIKDYISQAHELGMTGTASFSGGEAIMYYDQLKECVAHAKEMGMKASLVTNGFWARNERKGKEMMEGLVSAGLTDVSFSVDNFHQEYVSYETVAKAMKICEDLGVLSAVTIMDVKDGQNVRSSVENLRGELYNKNLTVYPVFPAGAAAETIPDDQIIRECETETALCAFDKSIVIMFDGSIRMCCSQFSHEIDMVKLGQFGKTPLKEAIESFNQNDFIYVLLKNQFKWYADLATKLSIPVAQKYSIPCELCHHLFTNKTFTKRAAPYIKKEADRLRLEKLFE